MSIGWTFKIYVIDFRHLWWIYSILTFHNIIRKNVFMFQNFFFTMNSWNQAFLILPMEHSSHQQSKLLKFVLTKNWKVGKLADVRCCWTWRYSSISWGKWGFFILIWSLINCIIFVIFKSLSYVTPQIWVLSLTVHFFFLVFIKLTHR